MGPRSENRGYACLLPNAASPDAKLQWVHGPRTVVIAALRGCTGACGRCFNGSTVREPWLSSMSCTSARATSGLQWVHGPRTVVIGCMWSACSVSRAASMGPRSENRGYARSKQLTACWHEQASMGPRSENRGYAPIRRSHRRQLGRAASMGPRSENRGYRSSTWRIACRQAALQWVHGSRTVVIATRSAVEPGATSTLQWVHGPRTVVIRRDPS